jgi:DNA transposition AAA+ family ATPase
MTATQMKVNPGTAPLTNVALCMQLITRLADRPSHLPGIGVFYGPSGYGKTTAAVHGAVKTSAYYIECGSSWYSASLVDAILHEISGQHMRAPIANKVSEIIRLLADDPRPLIIDEADHLIKKTMVDMVREISDKSGAPIILMGEEQLPAKLVPFERAHNRVLEWVAAQPADVKDARQLAKLYAPAIEIADDLLAHIIEITDGCTRRVVINIDRVRDLALSRGVARMALKDLGEAQVYSGTPKPRPRQLRRRAA